MKKLLLSLSVIMVLSLTIGLTACGHEHNYVDTVIAPTCNEQGYTIHRCECGDEYIDSYVNALGHSFTNYVSDNNATCESDGTKTAKCNHFGCNVSDTVTDVGSKLGHDFTNYVSNNDATCESDGTKTACCNHTGCNERDTITDEGSALGHNYGMPTYSWNADYSTCTATRVCLNDNKHIETETVRTQKQITQNKNCTLDELSTFTATFTNSVFSTQVKENISLLSWSCRNIFFLLYTFATVHNRNHK